MNIPVNIYKVIRLTPVEFHCWCDSNVGKIKKENKNVPRNVWNKFMGIEELELELKWWQRLWQWIKQLFRYGEIRT